MIRWILLWWWRRRRRRIGVRLAGIKLRPAQRARPVRRQPPVNALDVVHVLAILQLPHHVPFLHGAEANRALARRRAAAFVIRPASEGERRRHRLEGDRPVISFARGRGARRVLGAGASPPPAAAENEHCNAGEGDEEHRQQGGQRDDQRAG